MSLAAIAKTLGGEMTKDQIFKAMDSAAKEVESVIHKHAITLFPGEKNGKNAWLFVARIHNQMFARFYGVALTLSEDKINECQRQVDCEKAIEELKKEAK